MTYDCGCVNEPDAVFGILQNKSKCDFHRKWSADHPQGESQDYFRAMGVFDERGELKVQHYYDEFHSGFADLTDLYGRAKPMLEIGAGIGQYVPWFRSHDWLYQGLEPSRYAREIARQYFQALLIPDRFEDFKPIMSYQMIFAAHVFEHMKDAPLAIERCFRLLKPGGELWTIVPDDQDPVNPDHLWFFNVQTLHELLEIMGFKIVGTNVRSIVPQENFLYSVARKP